MATRRSWSSPKRTLLFCALGAVAAGLLGGCPRPVTELVLVVESELAAPSEIDRVEVVVVGPSGERATADADLGQPGAPRPPFTLGIQPAGTRYSPVHIRVVGRLRGAMVVERTVRTAFEVDRSVRVTVRLERACARVFCGVEQTCAGGQCVEPYLPAGLQEEVVRRFAPALDAGPTCEGAPGTPERCDGIDQDCDELVDEGFDFADDPAHCGGCGRACDDGVACLRSTCGDPAVAIAAGELSTCALRASGHVACWGANEVGQLGDGTLDDRAQPSELPGLDFVTQLGVGERHACAMSRDGRVRCWGWNRAGQLGDGTLTTRERPVVVPIEGVETLSVGFEHACVELRDGAVWCWGSRTDVGIEGELVNSTRPVQVRMLADPRALVAGNEATCVIAGAGTVACWGEDGDGRLGDGFPMLDQITPRPIAQPFVARSVGRYANGFFAIDDSGLAWGWGANDHGQLAFGPSPDTLSPLLMRAVIDAEQIAGGREHACARGGDAVRCWGHDGRGQLGRGTVLGEDRPAPAPVVGLPTGIREIASGGYHSCARTDAEIWCWGANDRGQIGDGTFTDRPRPVRVVLPGATR